MDAISQTAFIECIFFIENIWSPIKISLAFIPKGPIDHKSTLVQVMAWRRIGAKPLPEQMMTYLNDANMRHPVSMS